MAADPESLPPPQFSVPNPDPTERTKSELIQAIAAVRALLEAKLDAVSQRVDLAVAEHEKIYNFVQAEVVHQAELNGSKFHAIDEKFELRSQVIQRLADEQIHAHQATAKATEVAVENLRQMHLEKFASVSQQFHERDTRTEAASRADRSAIVAALTAQKEAGAKAEAATGRQIDQLTSQTANIKDALDDKIGALSASIATMLPRGEAEAQIKALGAELGAVEKQLTGSEAKGQGRGEFWGYLLGALGGVAILLSIAATIITVAFSVEHTQQLPVIEQIGPPR